MEERLPDEFCLDKLAMGVQGDFPSFPVPDLSVVAAQEFHYIGHGGQAVAFASEDNRYVLKFFLTRQMHGAKKYPIPKPTHFIPSHREKRKKQREKVRERSLYKAMHNYAIAFEKIPEKTGIIALHLNASKEPLPTVILKDFSGKKHVVDLTAASFVFQHKALLVKEKLATLPQEEDKQKTIASLRLFFEERAKSGFIDTERSFMINDNYGFLGDTPIQLDVGNIEFLEDLQKSPEEEISRMHGLLQNWAERR